MLVHINRDEFKRLAKQAALAVPKKPTIKELSGVHIEADARRSHWLAAIVTDAPLDFRPEDNPVRTPGPEARQRGAQRQGPGRHHGQAHRGNPGYGADGQRPALDPRRHHRLLPECALGRQIPYAGAALPG